ncbi:MAG: c-type cytochrome [Planctomycetes bacterium]|nr:c-type cytochrome [Planctomycetota bacterium]
MISLIRLGIALGPCLLLFAVALLVNADTEQRNWEIFTEMQYSVAHEAFGGALYDVLPNGQTLQNEVPGTVARGHAPLVLNPPAGTILASFFDEMRYAGETIQMPAKLRPLALAEVPEGFDPGAEERKVLARGQKMFETYCLVCHGELGSGKPGPLVEFGVAALDLSPLTAKHPDGTLYYIISRGGPARLMPGYAAQILPEDRWKIIRYLRTEEKPAQ